MSTFARAVAETRGGALLRVRVMPRSKVTRLEGVHGDAARLRVAAPPAVLVSGLRAGAVAARLERARD